MLTTPPGISKFLVGLLGYVSCNGVLRGKLLCPRGSRVALCPESVFNQPCIQILEQITDGAATRYANVGWPFRT